MTALLARLRKVVRYTPRTGTSGGAGRNDLENLALVFEDETVAELRGIYHAFMVLNSLETVLQ